MPRTANEYVRKRWLKLHRGLMQPGEKAFHRQMFARDLEGGDELSMTAVHWLRVQRQNHLWPRSPRTSAWGQRYENCGWRWASPLPDSRAAMARAPLP